MKHDIVHYHTHFMVGPKNDLEGGLTNYLIRQCGDWIFHKYKRSTKTVNGIIQAWLFGGGKWIHDLRGVTLTSGNLLIENGLPSRYWALRLAHKDDKFRARNWRTDIAFTEFNSNEVFVSFTVSYFLDETFLGIEPAVPSPSSPNLVKSFVSDENLIVTSGRSILNISPKEIAFGPGRDFIEEVQHPERNLPIVLIKQEQSESNFINADNLAKILAGNANIYVMNNSSVEEEVAFYFKGKISDYKCPWNAVRIYLPQLNTENPNDYKRHRFFQFKNFNEDPNILINILTKGLSKPIPIYNRDLIGRIEDIEIKWSQRRLIALQNSRDESDDKEYIALLEVENSRLIDWEREATQKIQSLDEAYEFLHMEFEDTEQQLKTFQKNYDQLTVDYNNQLSILIKKDAGINKFKELPSSFGDCVNLISELFSDRIIFLQEAIDSAYEFSYPDLAEAWSLLWAISNELYDLYFSDKVGVNITQAFANLTGHQITLSETSMTKADSRLMKLRRRIYKGNEVDITPHAKLDKGKANLRIHYHIDRDSKFIVVGHCGEHLETAGTKRRKEG